MKHCAHGSIVIDSSIMSISDSDDQNDSTDTLKSHKKKVAIIFGYQGTGYQGMQVNKSARTIEGTLFEALCKGKFVSLANSLDQKKISLMRSCRTDKGVHAAMQVVSAKLVIPQVESLTTAYNYITCTLNELLPKDIQVYGIQRTSNSFHARNHCDSRVYEYLLPTYILSSQAKILFTEMHIVSDESSSQEDDLNFPELDISTKDAINMVKRNNHDSDFRISSEALTRLRTIMNAFEGSHSFHNYTIGKLVTDPSIRRVIKSFRASNPFLQSSQEDSLEWIRLSIHGQSFMMHQIRKMVGMLILLMRASADITHQQQVIRKTLSTDQRYNIPKAPGFGLLLHETCFDSYNRKFAGKEQQLSLTPYKVRIDCA